MFAATLRAHVAHVARVALPTLAIALSAAPALAQRTSAKVVSAGTMMQLTPYVGTLISGKALSGPLGTSVSNSVGALFGAEVALKLVPGLALVGNLGYSAPEVRGGVPFLGSVHLGSSKIWVYDAGLQLSLPASTVSAVPLSPFLEGGIGSMRYEVSSVGLTGKATNVAYNVGGGADIILAPNFGVRVFAKDYIGRFDFKDATGFDVNGEMAHHVALGVGLRLDF